MANSTLKTKEEKVVLSEKPIFSWQSPDFLRYEKDNRWLITVIAISLVLMIVFVLLHQWSGVAMVFVAAAVFITLSGAHPKTINCAIYTEGIVVDNQVSNFEQFQSFWVGGNTELPKIVLQKKGRFAGIVNMPMKDEDPEQIRLFLSKHIPEEERGEDMTDMINRILRF